jgi:tetratricopeptide (TPR) repeat protein
MARLSLYYYHDFKTVETEYETIRMLAPSNDGLIGEFSNYLIASGRFDEASEFVKVAYEHNPGDASRYISLALISYFNGDNEKSSAFLDSALSLYPHEGLLVMMSVRLYNYMSRYKDAINLYDIQPVNENEYFRIPYFTGHLGVARFMTGNSAMAEKCLNELLEISSKTSIGSPSYFAAAIYTAMDQNDNALSMLEKAFEDSEVEIYWLKVEPLFIKLHGDPRFEKLIDMIGYN